MAGRLRALISIVSFAFSFALVARTASAQARVGADSATRLTRFGRDIAWGTVEGIAFSGVDQVTHDPARWGTGWPGYEKRLASNLGEFYIQESVTEGLAAIMNRPVAYTPCTCRATMARISWALHGAFTDQMPDGTHPLAIPRIAGAYVGSFAQAGWRPSRTASRARVALVDGTVSLALGGLINLYHEFHHHRRRQ